MSQLKVYNTLTKSIEVFIPLHGKTVGMYSCGPTVYNRIHIGNLRSYIFADILRRTITEHGYNLTHVMNITDVGHLTDDADAGEDKLEKAARERKASAFEIAQANTHLFLQDLQKINVQLPDHFPKATEHINDQIALIQRLEEKGYIYRTSDGIYFDTVKFPTYGVMANIHGQQLKEGARVEKNPEKRNPTDFALWKFSPQPGSGQASRQMEWPSPWGIGFPGWHIECSAMSMKYLGESFDVHTGGIDHIPIHHTNEIAQSEAATGKQFVKYWLHNEFLRVNDDKMARSSGQFITLDELESRGIMPLAYRYFALTTHYRKPLAFSWEALEAAQSALRSLQDTARLWQAAAAGVSEVEDEFMAAVNDDLNIPKALGIMWDLMHSNAEQGMKRRSLNVFDRILGLGIAGLASIEIPDSVKQLVDQRETARKNNDFAQADLLREQITALGYAVEDTPSGPALKSV